MRRRVLLALLVLLCVVFAVAFPVSAQAEGGIAVTASGHENRYPAQVKFTIQARSTSPISRVVLRYKPVNQNYSSYANVEFKPGTEVQAQYVWNTQRQYTPPGVELQYYWQVEDAAGNKAQTQPAPLTIDDIRFPWQKIGNAKLSLYWYKGDRAFAQSLLDAGSQTIVKVGEETGALPAKPVKIFIYETQKDLLGAMPPRDVEWTGGAAFSDAGIIVLTADTSARGRDYGLRTVAHELTHVIVNAATENPFGGSPQWLDEGLAMNSEGPLEQTYKDLLQRAASSGELLTLKTLSGSFPTDPAQAYLAYAQSYSVVKYLLSSYGSEKMSKLFEHLHEGAGPDEALKGAFGRDMPTLEKEWRGSIGAVETVPAAAAETPVDTAPTPALDFDYVPFALLAIASPVAVLLFLAGRRARWRDGD